MRVAVVFIQLQVVELCNCVKKLIFKLRKKVYNVMVWGEKWEKKP